MNASTVWVSSVFTAGVAGLAIAAALRATPLHLPGNPDFVNGATARAFESHYDAVFPARSLGISLWGAIEYGLFREGRPGVVVGEDDWLYTTEEFSAPADATAHIEAHLDQVAEVRDRLMRRGSRLIVALVPSKARVYPEHLEDRQPDPLHAQLYDRLLMSMRAQGIAAPDLMQALLLCKPVSPMFLRTDTHWTPAGAACAARAIAQDAQRSRLGLPPVQYRTTVSAREPYRGDLVRYLGLAPWFESLAPPPESLQRLSTVALAGNLLDEEPAPQVVLVGTSYSANPRWNFTGSLQQALHADIANSAAEGQGPFTPMLEFLHSALLGEAPRLVIWEMPERYFPISDGTAIQSLLDPGGPSS